MRVVDAAVDAGAHRRHEHEGDVVGAVRRPVGVARDLEEVDGVERVVTELDLGDRLLASECEPDAHPDDPPLVQGRVPRRLQPLSGREDAAEGRADVLAEDVGDAEVCLTHVKRHAHGLNDGGHQPSSVRG